MPDGTLTESAVVAPDITPTQLAFSSLTLTNVLAITAAGLLIFVSVGVIYLSTVEWRDRRRRQQPAVQRSRR